MFLIQLSLNIESFITSATELTNYAAFSQGNLSVETLPKIVSTIQYSANAISTNTCVSRDKSLQCLPSLFVYSCQTTRETLDSFINWLAENCPRSSPLPFLIQKLFWPLYESFKIASCIAPLTRYLHSIQMWRVIRWPLFLFKHLLTVLM